MVVVVRATGEHYRFDSDPEAYLHLALGGGELRF